MITFKVVYSFHGEYDSEQEYCLITNHPHQAWFLDRHPCGTAECSPLCAPGLWSQPPHLALSQLGRRAGNGIPMNLENGGVAFADSIWTSK